MFSNDLEIESFFFEQNDKLSSYQFFGSQDLSIQSDNKTQNLQYQPIQIFKKIQKDKKQVDENDMIVLKYKKKKKNKQYISFKLELPFCYKTIFHLSGHVLTEINHQDNSFFQVCIRQLEKTPQSYILYPQSINPISEFDQVIYMLENSQSAERYESAQMVKAYQQIVLKQTEICQQIRSVYDEDKLNEIKQERLQFKNEFIQKYTEQYLKDEYFYTIGIVGTNFNKNTSCLESVRFSHGLFALLGIEQKGLETILFNRHLLFMMLPPASRKIHFNNLLIRYLNNQVNFTQRVKDIELHTIDSIQLFCNIESKFIDIPYPPHLQFQEFEQFNISMDNISITKFEISQDHIKRILEQRQQNKDAPPEDFEYTMLSQIFIDKFYSTSQHQKMKQKEEKEVIPIIQEKNIQKQKRCLYKMIDTQ